MDIFTHAGIGLIAAAPLLNSRPELALGLVAGSVLPDLDAAARIFGKRAFLRAHQTWTHALPVQAGAAVLAGVLAHHCGLDGLLAGSGLLAGLALHTLLDYSNTLGVTLLAPFSRKRFCLEWVFFIDAFVLALTILAAGFTLQAFYRRDTLPPTAAEIYFGTLAGYFVIKGLLRRRAGRLAPGALSIMPSALWPWRFFAVQTAPDAVSLDRLNALTGSQTAIARQTILDATHAQCLAPIPEFALMRELSPAYHVVTAIKTAAGERVVCRDLRTRNFGTTFGDLEIWFDANRNITRTHFHV